ncbi:MAG: flagellar basal body-associated FliL family protein [Pseudomonadota bacterium]
MKKIVTICSALALLLGGGFGVYTVLNKPAVAAVDAHGEAAAKTDAKAEGEHGDAATTEFVALAPLMLPVVDKGGVSQMVRIMVSLEVPDAHTAENVKRLSPRLTDAYIQDMYGVLGRKAAMPDGVIQVNYLKQRLEKATVAVLGEGVVSGVLLQHVQQNPI